MQFFATVVLFAAAAFALPGGDRDYGRPQRYDACPSGLFSIPQCCDTDALGLLGLGCKPPGQKPTSAREFADCCRASSRRPRCCAVTALESGVLCVDPTGF